MVGSGTSQLPLLCLYGRDLQHAIWLGPHSPVAHWSPVILRLPFPALNRKRKYKQSCWRYEEEITTHNERMAALCCLAIIDYPTILGKSTWRWLAEKCREQPCKLPLNIHQTIRANNSFWKNVQMLSGHSLALLQGAIYCDGFTMFQTHYSWSEGFLIGDSPPAHCFCTAGVLVRPLSKTWSSCKMLCPQTCFILFNSGLWGFPASLISVYDLHRISWCTTKTYKYIQIYTIYYTCEMSRIRTQNTPPQSSFGSEAQTCCCTSFARHQLKLDRGSGSDYL